MGPLPIMDVDRFSCSGVILSGRRRSDPGQRKAVILSDRSAAQGVEGPAFANFFTLKNLVILSRVPQVPRIGDLGNHQSPASA
jgi:hypothetical protein